MEEEKKFKLSIFIISIILIAVWVFVMYWYVDNFYVKDFHWLVLLSIPLVVFFSLITVISGVAGLVSQFQVLRRKLK